MNPGDIVTTLPIPNNAGTCFRVYDMTEKVLIVDGRVMGNRMIDKFYHGEIAIVLESDDSWTRILTMRGIAGWIRTSNIRSIEEGTT